MNIKTHEDIDRKLCGTPVYTENGKSCVEMVTTKEMATDGYGLVHGGFVFGMADYAAMIAVNDPNVVLGGAETKFLKPVKVGEKIVAEAVADTTEGKKRMVAVQVKRDSQLVFEGTFACFVLDRHVLA